ncbi:MAG: hypothetical protein KA998_01100 [Rickettsiaceae bacterium]|nr:hypothetical protein [Rickettsiaceae bacterium]
MITLLASIAGFITSIVPEILRLLRDRQDKDHELKIFEKQIKYNRSSSNNPRMIDEIYVARDLAEQASLYSTYKTGISWVDALNGSVRPVLAYSFFIMYSAIKLIQYSAISDFSRNVELLWSVDDQAIFAGIISFYFGQRAFSKVGAKK